MDESYVIIGAGYAGCRAALCLRREGYSGRLIIIGDEAHPPYSRPPLCKGALLRDDPIERLLQRHLHVYERERIELVLGNGVESIDTSTRQLALADGSVLPYTKLLLATGGHPRRLTLSGADLPGVHVLRTYEDCVGLRDQLKAGKKLAIIGGGYIGLEAAAAARSIGIDVTLIELGSRLMGRVASTVTSEFFARKHIEEGVRLMLHRSAARLLGEDSVTGIELDDGQVVDTDIVLMAAGNIPEFRLAAEAGLECEGGIVVDEYCRTSDPFVYAAGDCTRHPSVRFGRRIQLESVDNALEQARVAAAGMCGRRVRHAHVPWFWSDQYGLKLQIVGLADGYDQVVVRGDPEQPGYSVWYLRGNELLCMETVANPLEFMQAGRWIGAHVRLDTDLLRDAAVPLGDVMLLRPISSSGMPPQDSIMASIE